MFRSAGLVRPMRSRRPWCFSHPTTAATSRERNCLWMAVSHRCRPSKLPLLTPRQVYSASSFGCTRPSFASHASLLDGDMMQAGQPPLRISPRLCSQLAQDFALRLGPEGPRHLQGSPPFPCEPHRLDPPVGVRRPLDHPSPLQEAKAARQRRLVNRELILHLLQTRLAQARDRRKNTELSHAETARPQAIVVELRHHAGDHAKCVADTGRQPSAALSGRQYGVSSTHGRHPISDGHRSKALTCRYIIVCFKPGP